MELHILSFFSVVAFHLAYIYGVQNEFYYFRTGTDSVQRNTCECVGEKKRRDSDREEE